ncbi:hypothetical protein [Magnetospirillum moscoviense]|uniref:hypothetical protein n=1 Tax=Magnetospirillum moscoviense TaxID=1437059 RepID=UPI0012E81EDF|nr:hypothetical protein [Magnetospirillum moscoviense]
MVDEIIFCDIRSDLLAEWSRIAYALPSGTPKASFMAANALEAIQSIPKIDVLFYRRDSAGEGGSHLFVLGDQFLKRLAPKFPPEGGLIITDGSNTRGSNFERMTRTSGMEKHSRCFGPAAVQQFEAYGLKTIMVSVRSPNVS